MLSFRLSDPVRKCLLLNTFLQIGGGVDQIFGALSMMRASTAEFFWSKSLPVGFIMLAMSKGLPLKKNYTEFFKVVLYKSFAQA